MAGDDDVSIKLRVEQEEAIHAFAMIISQFDGISESIKAVEIIAETMGTSTTEVLNGLAASLEQSAIAGTQLGIDTKAGFDLMAEAMGVTLTTVASGMGATTQAVTDLDTALKASADAQAANAASGVTSVESLAAAEKEYADQKIADETRVNAMSAESKAAIDKSTQALLAQGMSFKEVTEASGLTAGALRLIVDEQTKLQESSKTAFDRLIEGVKGSEVATVTAGVLMADALKGVGEAVLDLAKGFPSMIMAAAKAGDELTTMANRFNMTVDAVDEMKFVADQANVSFEGMGRASQRLGQQLGDDSSKASKAFKEMGLNAEELRKNPEEALYTFIKAVKETVPPADQASKMIEVLGSRAGQLTGLLKENIPALQEDAKQLGSSAAVMKIVAAEGETLQDNIGRIHRKQEAWRDEMASHFLPIINDVLHAMPMLGGGVLTFGEAVWDASGKLVPLIGNLALLSSSKVGASFLEWAGGLLGLTTATDAQTLAAGKAAVATGEQALATEGAAVASGAAVAPTTLLAGAMGLLQAAILPVTIALAAAYAIYKTWQAAGEESGWVRYVSDGFERLGLALSGYTKEQTEAMIAQDHATQKAVEAAKAAKELADAKAKQAADAKAAQDLIDAALEKQGTALQRLAASTKEVDDAFQRMSAVQKAAIKDALAHGKSAKEIADIMHKDLKASTEAATEAIKLYDASLKEAEKSAKAAEKADPFSKMVKSATELGNALKASAGSSIEQLVQEYGKHATEVVNLAATMKDGLAKITPETMKVAEAFNRAEIDKKLLAITEKSDEVAASMKTKLVSAATAAAAALKGMADSLTASTLTGTDLKIFQIEKTRDDAIAAQQAMAAAAVAARDTEEKAAWKAYDANKKMLEEKRLAGQQVAVEDEKAIDDVLDAALKSAGAQADLAKVSAQNQIGMLQMTADAQLAALDKGTGYYEKDAADRGVITKKAAQEELKVQTQKLALMKAAGSNATEFEKQQQTQLVNDLSNLAEKDLQQRGLKTQQARDKEFAKAKTDLDAMIAANKDGKTAFYQWEIDAQQRKVDVMSAADQKEAVARGLTTKQMLKERAADEQSNLDFMLANSQDFTKAQIEEEKKKVNAAKIASGEISTAWADGLAKWGKVAGQAGDAMVSLGKSMDSKILVKFGEGLKFASDMMDGLGGVMSAMAKGDTIGAIMAGVSMATKAVGKLWDAFTTSKGEKAMKSINSTFKDSTGEMLHVSEDFGNKMAESAKKWFGGNQLAAQLYGLKDIINEAGGLSVHNFDDMTKHLGQVFEQVGKGTITVEQATKVLDENFSTFAKHTLESGKIATKGFQDIIALNAQVGTQSKEIADFVSSQVSKLGGLFQKMLAPMATAAGKIKESLDTEFEGAKKIAEERDKLLEKIGTDSSRYSAEDKKNLDDINAKWAEQQEKVKGVRGQMDAMATASMPEVHRAGNLLTASFAAATKSGMSMLDAVDGLGPGLDELLKTTESLGITTEAAGLAWIVDFRDRVNVNRELVDSAGSLNDIMMAMSNIGALDADSFKELQDQGNSTYQQLRDKGFEQNEALKMMAGYLDQARTAHEQMGLPIDENTQKLIDQAVEQGILKDQTMSTNDIMMQGLSAIIKALGGELPAAFDKMSKTAVSTASTVGKALDKGPQQAAVDTKKELAETDWEGYAKAGVAAATATKDAADKLVTSVNSIAAGLDTRKWNDWADAAVKAAERVQDAVDAVSLGHSPGGIKEMPIKLRDAVIAFNKWEQTSVMSAKEVEDAINDIALGQPGDPVGRYGDANNAAMAANRIQSIGDVTVNINTEAIDSSARSKEVAEEMMKQFTQILSRRVQYSVAT